MNLKIKVGLIVLVLLLVVACSDQSNSSEGAKAEGNDYPKQDIDIIAGGGPGGGTDLFSRAVARELSDILGVNVNVVNMPGAAGSVASKELDKRKGDGYTIMPTTSDLQINIASERTEDYLEKFDALARVHEDTYLLWVSEDSGFETIDDFLEYAKDNPNEVTIGGAHSDGLDDLMVRMFEEEAGVELNYIPYEETGKFQSDLVGGHIDVIIDELGPSVGLFEGGEIKPLVVFHDEKIDGFPDVPTAIEKDINLTNGMGRGFVIKGDVPDDIKQILESAIKEAVETERYKEFAANEYLDLKDGWLDAANYKDSLVEEVDTYKQYFE